MILLHTVAVALLFVMMSDSALRVFCLSAQFGMDMKQCCVKLSVQPSRGLMDEKFIVLVQNAPPGFQLTVHALHHCEDGHSWEAFGHYTTDATGTVNGTWLRTYWEILFRNVCRYRKLFFINK